MPVFFRAAAASSLVLAVSAFLACTGRECAPSVWDLQALEWLAAKRGPTLDALFKAVTWMGSFWLLLPLALVLVAALAVSGHGAKARRFAATFGGAVVLGYVAKLLVARPRPSAMEPLIALPGDSSFPSGHAMQVTAFALAAILALAPATQRGRWLVLALVVIVLVGVSRLYLQVHFPSDVLAGTAAAVVWVLAFVPANRRGHA
jgi:membrane-associated phospholipid phosphatase